MFPRLQFNFLTVFPEPTPGKRLRGSFARWQCDASQSGRLKLDANVRAPRGNKVDAGVTGGDFIPADRGITVNREMQE
jgi:hypothetical protein